MALVQTLLPVINNMPAGIVKTYLFYDVFKLINSNDGTFETSIGNWQQNGDCVIAQSAAEHNTGSYSCEIFMDEAVTGSYAANNMSLSSEYLPALVLGREYKIKFYAKNKLSGAGCTVANAGDNTGAVFYLNIVNTWTLCEFTFTATADDVSANVIKIWTSGDGKYIYIDDIEIIETTPTTFNSELTYPTSVRFLSVSPIRESVDAEAGVTEFDNADIDVKEDYSTYPEGFWHRLINTYPAFDFELMFTIMEGSDETFLFRGKIYRINIQETEHYLDDTVGTPSKVVRGVAFKLVSSLKVLEEVSLTDLLTECASHYWTYGSITAIYIKSVIASMIKLAYGESYSESLVVNYSGEILFQSDALAPLSWSTIGIDVTVEGNYLDSSGDYQYSWIKRFANAYDLLQYLCRQFAIIPRYSFGDTNGLISGTPANNKHRLSFNSRGNPSGSTVTMSGKLLNSVFSSDTPRKARTVRITEVQPHVITGLIENYWYLKDVLQAGEPPPFAEFDIDTNCEFRANLTAEVYNILYQQFGGVTYAVNSIWYYDYTSPAHWVHLEDGGSHTNLLAEAIAKYYYDRFSSGRVQYEREYKSIKANNGTTNSQRNCQTLMRHVIHDGVIERTFYATEVEKDIFTNKVKVCWVQE
ncbi:MAG: hypothetical protein IMZ53_12935 [Thermoplasmata archaeon]|nr:hypothetical protein [Thermoplasmata archaeon]